MKNKKNDVITRLKGRIKPENRIFVQKNLAISKQVELILAQKAWTQKELALKLGKSESEVSKWLSGLHNLTLQSIAKLESALDSYIIVTPLEVSEKFRTAKYVPFTVESKPGDHNKVIKPEYSDIVKDS